MTVRHRTALALGGGGARGAAHLGVMRYLESRGHRYDCVVGTSAGAIFAALYLLSRDSREALERLNSALNRFAQSRGLASMRTRRRIFFPVDVREKLYVARSLIRPSILPQHYLRQFVRGLIGSSARFEDCRKPLYITATDLISGRDIVFSRGELLTPLMASSCLPGVFPPVASGDFLLVDGGGTQKVPSGVALSLGVKRVLGVDVGKGLEAKNRFRTAAQTVLRSDRIVSSRLHHDNLARCDLLLSPRFENMRWHEFDRCQEAFQAGVREAEERSKAVDRFFRFAAFRFSRRRIHWAQEPLWQNGQTV